MPTPQLANEVTIDKRDGHLLVNGEEFPWFVGDDITIDGLSSRDMTSVNISVLTKRVTVIPLKGDEVTNDQQ